MYRFHIVAEVLRDTRRYGAFRCHCLFRSGTRKFISASGLQRRSSYRRQERLLLSLGHLDRPGRRIGQGDENTHAESQAAGTPVQGGASTCSSGLAAPPQVCERKKILSRMPFDESTLSLPRLLAENRRHKLRATSVCKATFPHVRNMAFPTLPSLSLDVDGQGAKLRCIE